MADAERTNPTEQPTPPSDIHPFEHFVAAVEDYAIFTLDPAGIIQSWNRGAERIKQYAAGEIVGRHFSEFYPETDRAKRLPEEELETATREGRFEDEGWRLRKDGSQFWAGVTITAVRSATGEAREGVRTARDRGAALFGVLSAGGAFREPAGHTDGEGAARGPGGG